ncbi:hypothetical protein M9Y10_026777 [Tritrichomonas musculus]|uniref:UBC core domain-containing protein n=1 Tax=Tritrichomonas musculus TaxID=1915356 RepID=A0ABR2H7W9_9EUKA
MRRRINYSIDDEAISHAVLVDSSYTIQQSLQFIRDRINDQGIQYVYAGNSIIEDLNDNICDWIDQDTVFNFRHSRIESLLRNQSSNNYNLTVFTTASWDSLTRGQTFTVRKDSNREEFESLIQVYCSSQSRIPISQMKLLIFLPGGVEFKNTTIRQYVEATNPRHLNMYVVVTNGISSSLLSREIVEICDTRGEMSTIFSPLVDSSNSGKQLFSCLLSSLFHQTTGREELLKSLSQITGFPPLISSLQALINRKTITGKDLIIISSTLFPIFRYLIGDSVSDSNVLESCCKLCNLISKINCSNSVPLTSITDHSNNSQLNDLMLNRIRHFMSQRRITILVLWIPDFEVRDFPKTNVQPFTQRYLQTAWSEKKYFKPVKPLSLLQVHVSSIVYGPRGTYRVFPMEVSDSKEREAASKVDLINPENGETSHVDIEEFARTVQVRDDNQETVELIDEESVQQMTMVLIDQSLSMEKPYDGRDGVSRDSLAKQYLTSWASKSFGYRISSLQGLISFASKVVVKSPLSPLIPDFEQSVMNTRPDGCTLLWPAIKKAAEMLVAKQIDPVTHNNKFQNAKLRILVLTDGVDEYSNMSQYDVLPYLIENNIIVDVVIVSTVSESKDVCVLAQLTGGMAFRPSNTAEGIALFEKEALLSISYREKPQPYTGEITREFFESLRDSLVLDTEPKNRIIMQARSRQPLMTTRIAIRDLDGTSQDRLRRIAKELRIAYRWEDQDVKVYPVENLADRWRIYIKGPEGTPYSNKWWDLFAEFPENYPLSPPTFRFITVPFHINISNEGRICMNTLGSDYSSTTHVMELIANIKALLILPNYQDPIDIAKLTLYNQSNDHHEFNQRIRDSVRNAKDDYNDYLSSTPISDDQNYHVLRENYVAIHQRCPISGIPLDPANTVVASSGIRYDRDALKRLLRSMANPRCVVTHRILTDNPDSL